MIALHYPADIGILLNVNDLASDVDGEALFLNSAEFVGSQYQPQRADSLIEGLIEQLAGRVPDDRREWARHSIWIGFDQWSGMDEKEPDGVLRDTLRVSIEDAEGELSIGEIPVEFRISEVAYIEFSCSLSSGELPGALSVVLSDEHTVLEETRVRSNRVHEWMISLFNMGIYLDDVERFELEAKWNRNDNPFTLDCEPVLYSDGIGLPMNEVKIVGVGNRAESSHTIFVHPQYMFDAMEPIFSRIYDREVDPF